MDREVVWDRWTDHVFGLKFLLILGGSWGN